MQDLFDLKDLESIGLFDSAVPPWEWLKRLEAFLFSLRLEPVQETTYWHNEAHRQFDLTRGPVYVLPGTVIHPSAVIQGPACIGVGVRIGPHALIRDSCLIMDHCSIGHASEIKHAILFPRAVCGHRNFVGDSILGRHVNMGNGSSTANLRVDRDPKRTTRVTWNGEVVDTGLRKFGALVGDESSIGCQATLQPGTILGRGCLVHPNIAVSRTHPAETELSPSYAVLATPRKKS